MSAEKIESKVNMTEVHATEGGFWVNPEQTGSETVTNVNIEVSTSPITDASDGSCSCAPVFVTVRATIADSGATPIQRASFNVRLTGKIVISPEAEQECRSDGWLRAFTVSSLYPQAQAYITMLAGMAQAFGISLPSIDPQDIANLS